MSNAIQTQPVQNLADSLAAITARLTIGSTVCITEGLFTAITVMTPRNHWLYIVGIVLTLATWLAFWRFRDSKLGAEMGDLCFFDLIIWISALALYQAGIDPDRLWFFFTTVFTLKIFRVYISQHFATQQFGWGQFGFMTRRYERRSPSTATAPWKKLAGEILLALVMAAMVCTAIRLMNDFWRVVVVWIVPLSFEIIYGPRQLQNLALLNTQLKASAPTAPGDEAEVEEMRRTIAAYRNQHQSANAQPDEALAKIIEAYYKTVEMKRADMMEFAEAMAKAYPESDYGKD